MEKRLFEMSEDDYKGLLDACKPTPVMYLSGGTIIGGSPQENANSAWQGLANKLGFVWDTVTPAGGNPRVFMAEPVDWPKEPVNIAAGDATESDADEVSQ